MTEPLDTGHSSPENSGADITTEINKWLEGNPMGSTKSKAFCDQVDLYDRQAKLGLVEFSKDEATIEDDIRSIRERIRLRENELPGYLSAVQQISGSITKLEEAEASKTDALYYIDQGITPSPKPVVRSILNAIKTQHISQPAS
ncbi:MAG: hypothetical protein KBD51_00870 [Candidatus Levybacteria bacterium]|nr:hypothetical protein [Candidatus Levybacteria bacterium]